MDFYKKNEQQLENEDGLKDIWDCWIMNKENGIKGLKLKTLLDILLG